MLMTHLLMRLTVQTWINNIVHVKLGELVNAGCAVYVLGIVGNDN